MAQQVPSSAVAQRDLAVSLVKLAATSNSGIRWQQVADQFQLMADNHMLLPTDEQYLQVAKALAAQEAQ